MEMSWILNIRLLVHARELSQNTQEPLTAVLEDMAWKSVSHEPGTEI